MINPIHRHDPLDAIEACLDGTTCPDARWCRKHKPEICPLLNDQFELDPEVPLDKVIKDTYCSGVEV